MSSGDGLSTLHRHPVRGRVPGGLLLVAGILISCLLPACKSIWNAGDLAEWVREEATSQGCLESSIELDDWYTETENGNFWRGRCVQAASVDVTDISISVDEVWTPSQ